MKRHNPYAMKDIYNFLNTPKEVIDNIERTKDAPIRCELEGKIIDKYLIKFVQKFGYIPKDCTDDNILYSSCLGCGLCIGTNPIQQKTLPKISTLRMWKDAR